MNEETVMKTMVVILFALVVSVYAWVSLPFAQGTVGGGQVSEDLLPRLEELEAGKTAQDWGNSPTNGSLRGKGAGALQQR
jgi:hypothetical protein